MKRIFKKAIVIFAVTVLCATSLPVSAAGLRDVFNAKYYADSYADLKATFGDNEELLYNHFINYGLKENRNMNPLIDIQAYRAAYPDLEAAFGDNWDYYVEHYLTFGAKEGRTEGVLFNPVAYAAAYPDVAAVCGSDISAIIAHYVNHGIAEGRTAGVVTKESAKAEGSSGGGSSSSSSVTPPAETAVSVDANGSAIIDLSNVSFEDSNVRNVRVTNVKKVQATRAGINNPALHYEFAIIVNDLESAAATREAEPATQKYIKINDTWHNVTNNRWDNLSSIVGTVNPGTGNVAFGIADDGNGGPMSICLSKKANITSDVDLDDSAVVYNINVSFQQPSIYVYEVDANGDSKKIKGTHPVDVQKLTGSGTSSADAYKGTVNAEIMTYAENGIYWLAIEAPCADLVADQNLHLFIDKDNTGWTKLSDVTVAKASKWVKFAVGLSENEVKAASTNVKFCLSTATSISSDTATATAGVYYDIKFTNLKAPASAASPATIAADNISDNAVAPASLEGNGDDDNGDGEQLTSPADDNDTEKVDDDDVAKDE